jgi:DNA adenine methylase
VGGGSVFLAASFASYVIGDANPDLIAVWVALQSRPIEFMARAAGLFAEENRNAEAYLRIRAAFNQEVDRYERAVTLPYLNRFGFNGLFRVNRSGQFNVPYGKPASLPGFPWERMEAAARKLATTTILGGGFRGTMDVASVGDVVYCDPPYSRSHTGSESFTSYTNLGFSHRDHEELVEASVVAVSRGATVLISNHDTPETRELYTGWHIHPVEVRRSISASSDSRGMARELVASLPS